MTRGRLRLTPRQGEAEPAWSPARVAGRRWDGMDTTATRTALEALAAALAQLDPVTREYALDLAEAYGDARADALAAELAPWPRRPLTV